MVTKKDLLHNEAGLFYFTIHYSLFTSEAPIVCPLRGASAATSMQTSVPLQ